jgi:hypothetical protein
VINKEAPLLVKLLINEKKLTKVNLQCVVWCCGVVVEKGCAGERRSGKKETGEWLWFTKKGESGFGVCGWFVNWACASRVYLMLE